jgi:hypothetical protein
MCVQVISDIFLLYLVKAGQPFPGSHVHDFLALAFFPVLAFMQILYTAHMHVKSQSGLNSTSHSYYVEQHA